MSPGNPTLAHVAHRAGVSKTTASASLRDLPGPSEQTKERVRQAAMEIGYRANVGAKSLRQGLKPTAALIMDPFTLQRRLFVDAYWAKFMNSLFLTASANQLPVTVISAAEADALAGHQVDAVLFMTQAALVDRLETFGFGLPLLALSTVPLEDKRLTTVLRHDHARLIRNVFDHLWEQGCRRPAFTIGREWKRDVQMGPAFDAWCASKGIEPVVIRVTDPNDEEETRQELAAALTANKVDGVYTLLLDPTAIIESAELIGKSVPADIALVAQTEWESIPLWPYGLSNVSYCGTPSGEIAANALLAAINGEATREIELPFAFSPRASSRA